MAAAVVTQAPKIVVLRPIADRTLTVPGSAAAICVTAFVSQKGPVGRPVYATRADIVPIFGKPLPMHTGVNAEGLRHVDDALAECQYGYFVRVLADDARYPSLAFTTDNTTAIKSNHRYGYKVAIGDPMWLAIWPKDGDPSTGKRRVSILDKNEEDNTFVLFFEEKVDGEWLRLERHEVSTDPDSRNDLGIPNYAPSYLESFSQYFDCDVEPDTPLSSIHETTAPVEFEGGTNGGEPTMDDWKEAWERFRTDDIEYNLAFAAGQYDHELLHHMHDICDEKLVQFRFDIPPYLNEQQAKQWLIDLNMGQAYQAQAYHYPYKANDPWYGGKSVWGVSGEATAAKARCFATVTGHADIKGAHFSAAGEKRGFIERSGIEPLHRSGFIPAEEKVDVKDGRLTIGRFNPVDKGKIIGDVLTMYRRNNYLRFEHVIAIHNAVMHDIVYAARLAKFEPDGLTREILTRVCTDVLDKYLEAGAFVKPREPEIDGENPYNLILEQQEIDLWKITVEFCPTGVFRRGAVQTVLLK